MRTPKLEHTNIYNSRNSKELLDAEKKVLSYLSTTVEIQRNFLIKIYVCTSIIYNSRNSKELLDGSRGSENSRIYNSRNSKELLD